LSTNFKNHLDRIFNKHSKYSKVSLLREPGSHIVHLQFDAQSGNFQSCSEKTTFVSPNLQNIIAKNLKVAGGKKINLNFFNIR
jgi:hypothetical protein